MILNRTATLENRIWQRDFNCAAEKKGAILETDTGERMTEQLSVGIKRGPSVLFLGQKYLSLRSGKDAFLEAIERKYGSADEAAVDYSRLFDLSLENVQDAESWMHRLSDRLSVPDWLETLSLHGWNAVYSSAIDSVWPRAFRTSWRDLERVYRDRHEPRDPRNKFKLHCTFLFGSVDRIEDEERAPLTEFQIQERDEVAIKLAGRLPEIITPLGLLLIEGYNGALDWFQPKRLYAIVNKLNPGQAHIFSVDDELLSDKYIGELIRTGKLIPHEESLAEVFLRLSSAGLIGLGKVPDEDLGATTVETEKEVVPIPVDLKNRVSRSALILDDSLLMPLPSVSKDRLYSEFLRFLAESALRPVWSGYERGFAFSRSFYSKLANVVRKKLSGKMDDDAPIILQGQTGTGKTIGLGALAYNIRREKKNPVLFIERKSTLPLFQDIDEFCLWMERHHCPATLVVWDGMVESEKYEELARYLQARGRRAVIVGSSYESSRNGTNSEVIEAPARLSSEEFSGFVEFLGKVDPLMSQYISEWKRFADESFLAALYRLLPTTRRELGSGIEREVLFAESELAQQSPSGTPERSLTSMELALRKAGLMPGPIEFSNETSSIAGEEETELSKLTNLVMVPGRFGLRIPIELLLRSLGRQGVLHFVDLLKRGRVFSWNEDDEGNISIGPRHSLEAQLLVERRLGGPAGEIEYAEMLLKEIRDVDIEIDFTIDLLGQLGPSTEEKTRRYKMFFQRLGDVLTFLREKCGIRNVRLMLKEAHFLRESTRQENSQDWSAQADSLRRAEELLREALTVSEDNRFKSQLLAELGINLASQAANPSISHATVVELYRASKIELVKARTYHPENAHPVEILSRIVPQMLNSALVTEHEKAEVRADLISIYEMCDAEQYAFTYSERYQSTRNEVMNLLGRKDLSDEAFEALKSMGSKAGYYLRAQRILGEIGRDRKLTTDEIQRCNQGLTYLETHFSDIAGDGRCLYLMVRLWWQCATGKPLFFEERQTAALTTDEWRKFLTLVTEVINCGESYRSAALRYLEAIGRFHLGQVRQCTEILREIYVSRTAMQKSKTPSYLASEMDGKPTEYFGNVSEVSRERGKGKVFVEGLSINIPFFPQQFNRPEIREHEALRFHIAFNFTGLLAEPITLTRSRNE